MDGPQVRIARAKLEKAKLVLHACREHCKVLEQLWTQGAIPENTVLDGHRDLSLAKYDLDIAIAELEEAKSPARGE